MQISTLTNSDKIPLAAPCVLQISCFCMKTATVFSGMLLSLMQITMLLNFHWLRLVFLRTCSALLNIDTFTKFGNSPLAAPCPFNDLIDVDKHLAVGQLL